jgi:hypothetical protein
MGFGVGSGTDVANRLPVYILNALYLAPITLWTYLKYGRPMTPAALTEWIKERQNGGGEMAGHMHMMHQEGMHEGAKDQEKEHSHEGHERHDMSMQSNDMTGDSHMNHEGHIHHMGMEKEVENGHDSEHNHEAHATSGHDHMHHMSMESEGQKSTIPPAHQHDSHATLPHDHMNHTDMENGKAAPSHSHAGHMQHGGGHNMSHMNHNMSNDPHMFHMMEDRPTFATITVAVCHCGAGCLLGDLVGEWLVYGTNAQINGKGIWPEFLIGISPCPSRCLTSPSRWS